MSEIKSSHFWFCATVNFNTLTLMSFIIWGGDKIKKVTTTRRQSWEKKNIINNGNVTKMG